MKMSKRKTFSQDILFCDAFSALPLKVRWLYLCLNYGADDDGFVASPNYLVNVCQCKPKDLKLLAEKGYLILFESGVALIAHWYVHNKPFRIDRYHETQFLYEKSLVEIDENKVYRKKQERKTGNDNSRSSQPNWNRTNPDPGDIVFRG